MMVSIYANATDLEGKEADLKLLLLEGIKAGRWRDRVEAVRAATGKQQEKLKSALPNFTGSGTFAPGRKNVGLRQHSGYVWIDIDAKDNPDRDLLEMRDELAADPYTYALHVTCRGKGLCLTVPIDPARHDETVQHLFHYYQQRYGLRVDTTCKNVARIRFVSYDPDLFLNEEAIRFEVRGFLKTDLEATIARIEQARLDLTSTYQDWLRIGFALAHECGEAGRDYFHRLSCFHAEYDATATDKKYNSCLKGHGASKATIATFYFLCQQAGIEPVRTMAHELNYQIRQAKRNGTQPDRVAAGLVMGRGLPKDDVEALVDSIYSEELQTITGFWHIDYNDEKERRTILIPRERWVSFLATAGFRRYDVGSAVTFVQIEGQLVRPVTRSAIKQYITDYVESLPFEFYGRQAQDGELPAFYQVYRTEIVDKVMLMHRALFEDGQLEFLPQLPADALVRDTKTAARFFFRNAWVEVTAGGPTARPYDELPGLVWAEQVIDRDWQPCPVDAAASGQFGRFLANITGGKAERTDALLALIGYFLHGFKDPSVTRVGVLTDEAIGVPGEANGGTGKSLVFKAIEQMINVLVIDGRNYDPKYPFALASVTSSTRLILFDDWDGRRLPFERLYTMATDMLVIERKGGSQLRMAYDVSPKIGITTNDALPDAGTSSQRRKIEIEIASHYRPGFQPVDEFGGNFFTDWNNDEWHRFDTLMLAAVSRFLFTGLTEPVAINLNRRKLLQATSAAFVDFMESRPKDVRLFKSELRTMFVSAEGYDEKSMTPDRFARWLKAFALFAGVETEEGVEKQGVDRDKRFIILKSKKVAGLKA